MTDSNQLSTVLAPVKALPAVEQLKFWRSFRAIHRRRISKTEAALCPELLKAVDETIENLKLSLARGV